MHNYLGNKVLAFEYEHIRLPLYSNYFELTQP